jgi:A/G-specific adenine glycosylase
VFEINYSEVNLVMMPDKTLMKSFGPRLLKWDSEENCRKMPWKGQKDPYKIWLSEIILQQTRVDQGLKYYNKFIEAFPDVHALANALEQDVYKLWEGLGYYTRCRNLIKSANYISKDRKGRFPGNYEELLKLEGVGQYTASAIASFAYNHAHAVVDGNVYRVLARIFGITIAIDSSEGKIFFSNLANQLLDKKHPGKYNQAIMDFGASICKPVPLCNKCVFQKQCYAYQHNKISLLPVKQKKSILKKRWFYYLILEYKDAIAVRQRSYKDIWHNLFEYYLVEKSATNNSRSILKQAEKEGILEKNSYRMISVSKIYNQRLSHQFIAGQFINVKLNRKLKLNGGLEWRSKPSLLKLAFPKIINQYREEITGVKFD